MDFGAIPWGLEINGQSLSDRKRLSDVGNWVYRTKSGHSHEQSVPNSSKNKLLSSGEQTEDLILNNAETFWGVSEFFSLHWCTHQAD